DADVAEPDQEHAGRQRRRQDVDGVVAEQQGADQLLARRQDPVDDAGVAMAVLLQSQHRRARRSRQRGFAAGEKERQKKTKKNSGDGEPVFKRHDRAASFSAMKARTSPASTSRVTKACPI